jgi:hypothetical protein
MMIARMPKRLTDLQMWTLINSQTASDASLAALIGSPVATVHGVRWRLRKHPWTCRVHYGTCRYCGNPMAIRTDFSRHVYHARCYAENRGEIQRRIDALRPITQERIDAIHRWSNKMQQRTLRSATRARQRWTHDEDDIVLAMMLRPIEDTCIELGRSMHAVAYRRVILRRRPPRE